MGTKDLMIGDYFRVSKDKLCIKKGTIIRVRLIDANDKLTEKGLEVAVGCEPVNDDTQFSGGIWLNYLEPIPLTPEILEKNGFVYSDIPFEQSWQQFGLSIWGTMGNYHISCGMNISMDVRNVHELQHALRLCGIEKEIMI